MTLSGKFFKAEVSNQPNASPFFTFFFIITVHVNFKAIYAIPSDDPYVHGGSNDCLERI
jgi:hypothetical protein